MHEVLFIATERFDAADGERWQSYCDWAKIPSLRELVSLDMVLCKRLITTILDEDWAHIVNADYRLDYFYDLDYLLRRISSTRKRNVLGLYRKPDRHVEHPPAAGKFEFFGYDLIEEATQISALVNCGGFPEAFSNDELNEFGLVRDHTRATEIRRRLVQAYPDESHANCELYAIWRLNEADRWNVGG